MTTSSVREVRIHLGAWWRFARRELLLLMSERGWAGA